MSLGNSQSEDKGQEPVRVAQHDQKWRLLCGRMFDASRYSKGGRRLQSLNEMWGEVERTASGRSFMKSIFIREGA